MIDKLKNEINDGDLVVQVNYESAILGVVHGGITNGGKIRYISYTSSKESSAPYNLIVITKEQAQNFIEERLNWVKSTLDGFDEDEIYQLTTDDNWLIQRIINWELGSKQIMDIHEKQLQNS